MNPSQTQSYSLSPIKHAGVRALMERRLELGEFGTPPDMAKYHDELFKILEQGPKTVYHQVCPLWIKEGLNNPNKKVLFECNKTREEVTIPAGVKVLVLKNQKTSDTQPDASIVYVTEEY